MILRKILAKLWSDESDISSFEYAVLLAVVVVSVIFAS